MWFCLLPYTIATLIMFESVEETAFSEHSNSNVCNEYCAKQNWTGWLPAIHFYSVAVDPTKAWSRQLPIDRLVQATCSTKESDIQYIQFNGRKTISGYKYERYQRRTKNPVYCANTNNRFNQSISQSFIRSINHQISQQSIKRLVVFLSLEKRRVWE